MRSTYSFQHFLYLNMTNNYRSFTLNLTPPSTCAYILQLYFFYKSSFVPDQVNSSSFQIKIIFEKAIFITPKVTMHHYSPVLVRMHRADHIKRKVDI